MNICYNAGFLSIMLVSTFLTTSAFSEPWHDQDQERTTSCRAIDYNEERVVTSVSDFDDDYIDVSRIIERTMDRYNSITSVRIRVTADTSAMARLVVNGRSSDWFYPKVVNDYGDRYTVYCFDDIYTSGNPNIYVEFNSGKVQPVGLIFFVRKRY